MHKINSYFLYAGSIIFIILLVMGYNPIPFAVCAVLLFFLCQIFIRWKLGGISFIWPSKTNVKQSPYRILLRSADDSNASNSHIPAFSSWSSEEQMDDEINEEEMEDESQDDFGEEYENVEFEDVMFDEVQEIHDMATGDQHELLEQEDDFLKQYRQEKLEKVLSEVDRIPSMRGLEFEQFLKDLYDALGYVATNTNINDQGADLIVMCQNEKIVIQAKRYKNKVSNSAIQQVFAAKAFYDCDKAIVITNSEFTKSARQLAEKLGVELWDAASLKTMLESMKNKM